MWTLERDSIDDKMLLPLHLCDPLANNISNIVISDLKSKFPKMEILSLKWLQNYTLWDMYHALLKTKRNIQRNEKQNDDETQSSYSSDSNSGGSDDSYNVKQMYLWHGTDSIAINKITTQGFLRDNNKRSAYGKGVYFAKHPNKAFELKFYKSHTHTHTHNLFFFYV